MYSVECEKADGPNCTLLQNALDHFKYKKGDVLLWPEAINTMASDQLEPFAKSGPVTRELLHAFGSWYRSNNQSTNKVLTLTDTVLVDTTSWSFLVLLTIFVAMTFVAKNRSKVGRKKKFEKKSVMNHFFCIMVRMIELIFCQSTNLLVQLSTGFKLLFASFLFLIFFSFAIYRNIFGTELTVSQPEKNIDTIDQFNQSDLIPFLFQDESMYHFLQTQPKNDGSVSGDLLNLIRSRLTKKSFGIRPRDVWMEFVKQENSVIISSEFLQTVFERFTCFGLVSFPEPIRKAANYYGYQLINLYHVSNEKFLPIATANIYNRNISSQLESRLNRLFRKQLEHGLTKYYDKMFSQEVLSDDQIDHCINSIPVEGSNKDKSIPDPIVIDSLGNIFRLSAYSIATSFILVLIEIMVGEILLSRKGTPVIERSIRNKRRITTR